jgi:hypothetical protein
MKVMNVKTMSRWVAPITGVLSIIAVSSSPAALVAPGTPEIPGTLLGAGTSFGADPTLAGTVVGSKTVGFFENNNNPPLFQGTLRSVVVQNASGLLDFYFQVANTSNLAPVNTPPGQGADIFRFTLAGFNGFGTFPGDVLSVNYRTDGLAGIVGAGATVVGTKPAFSADRDPSINPPLSTYGGVGIDFDPSHFLGGPGNVDSGQTAQFIVIRTSARFFRNVENEIISSFGTALVSGFAPVAVPEPATLFAGLMLGSYVAFRDLGRGRRRQAIPAKA